METYPQDGHITADAAIDPTGLDRLLRMASPLVIQMEAPTVLRIDFVTAGVAVVDGEASLFEAGRPDSPMIIHRFIDIPYLLLCDGTWRIAHVRAYAMNDARMPDKQAAQAITPADRTSAAG